MSEREATTRREALDELIKCPGWQLFVDHVQREWRAGGYYTRMGIALGKGDPLEPQVVHRTAEEIIRILQWPGTQVRDLERKAE